MNLEFHYLHLALQLFPHARGHLEGQEYIPPCRCEQFALDSAVIAKDKTQSEHYRIRCIECNHGLLLPTGFEWESLWKHYFNAKYAQERMDSRTVGLDSQSANPVRVLRTKE